jgi:signal transduction histidine kinase
MDFDTVRRAGGIIDEATRKAARYILALRQSLDDQHAEFTKTPVDVGASLESVLILLGSRLGPVTLDQRLAPDLVALAHPGRLMQVWNRLLTNALDAMPDGGILTLVARRAGTEVVVEVGDTGARRPESWGDPGGPSLLETTPFGPGLGLAVAKAITEDYGGTLTFASEGERNQVTVRLPQASNKES